MPPADFHRCFALRLVLPVLLIVSGPLSAHGQYAFRSFNGTGGGGPVAPLILASDGNYYGTTLVGGAHGYGTVFRLTGPAVQTIYNFCSLPNCADGATVWGSLVQGQDGSLYGTTVYGGLNPSCEYAGGCGTVFRLTLDGTLATLWNFDAKISGFPYSGLLLGKDGNFYGTSSYTGQNDGTIFKITPEGALTVLHQFSCITDCADGSDPQSNLVQDSTGMIYGTTAGGGNNNSGVVFKITSDGTFTRLYAFCAQTNCSDGAKPNGVILASNGNLYGTTYSGGNNYDGTVFAMTRTGQIKILYKFPQAANPYGGVIQGADGNFYGTTLVGGTSRAGTIFKITPQGVLTTLHNFQNTDGALPEAALISDSLGNLYGTTSAGGSANDGVLFRLK